MAWIFKYDSFCKRKNPGMPAKRKRRGGGDTYTYYTKCLINLLLEESCTFRNVVSFFSWSISERKRAFSLAKSVCILWTDMLSFRRDSFNVSTSFPWLVKFKQSPFRKIHNTRTANLTMCIVPDVWRSFPKQSKL